jgi:hypothetical protein
MCYILALDAPKHGHSTPMFGGASNNEYGAFLTEELSDIKLWHQEDHQRYRTA